MLPGIDGLNALAFSQPVRGDFRQLSNAIAVCRQAGFCARHSCRALPEA